MGGLFEWIQLVSHAPEDGGVGGLAAADAGLAHRLLHQRHAAGGHAGLLLHFQLAVQRAAPRSVKKTCRWHVFSVGRRSYAPRKGQ